MASSFRNHLDPGVIAKLGEGIELAVEREEATMDGIVLHAPEPSLAVASHIDGLTITHGGALQMIDALIVRVPRHGHATQCLCSQPAPAGGNVVTSG